jgi:lipopolysaccharide/colanic/teichoic acid biosynthesis glycosyltransferase
VARPRQVARELVRARSARALARGEELVQVEDVHDARDRNVTRLLDITVAAAALLVSSPLLLAAAIAIRLESPGGVIYRHQRIGRDGVPFELWKLRTMVSGAETMGAGLYIEQNDARITRVGALLRRFSLDELPNLVNVLRGEMSVVGPRPTVAVQVDRYSDRQRRRLEVKPGITGWAQVNGRTSISWPERIELDVWYVDHRSLALDVKILLRTLKLLATGQGLYSSELEQGWGEKEG